MPAGGFLKTLVGEDGSVFLFIATLDDETFVYALDERGSTKEGWPIHLDELPAEALVADDGALILHKWCRIDRLKPDGRPAHSSVFLGDLLTDLDRCRGLRLGSGETVYLLATEPDGTDTVLAIDGSGRVKPGWPVPLGSQGIETADSGGSQPAFAGQASSLQVGRDGTVYVPTTAPDEDGATELWALTPDGGSRPGWPVRFDPGLRGFSPLADGDVYVWWGETSETGENENCPTVTERTVFALLGRDGSYLPGWPRGAKGRASAPVVGADDTLYYTTERGDTFALDRTATIRPGWPIEASNPDGSCCPCCVCEPRPPILGPDGNLYFVTGIAESYAPDGTLRRGWPWTPPDGSLLFDSMDTPSWRVYSDPVISPDGTVFLSVFAGDSEEAAMAGGGYVVALDANGQVKPGWPDRLSVGEHLNHMVPLPDGCLLVSIREADQGSPTWRLEMLTPRGRPVGTR